MTATIRLPIDKTGRPPIFTRGFITVCVATIAHGMAMSLTTTAMSPYLTGLGLSSVYVGAFLGILGLLALIMRLPIGRLIDRYGARWFGTGGAALVGCGCVLYAVSAALSVSNPELPGLFLLFPLAVLLHGVGFSIFGTATSAFVAYTVTAARRGEAVGYFGVAQTVVQAGAAGISLAIASAWGYQTVFLTAAAGGLIAAALVVTLRPVASAQHQAPAATDHRSPIEWRVVWPALATSTLSGTQGASLSFTVLLGLSRGLDNPGVFFTANALTGIAVRVLSGRITDRFNRMVMIVPGAVLATAGALLLSQTYSVEALLLSGIVFGAGVAAAQPSIQALVIDRAPSDRRGAAMATWWVGADLGLSGGAFGAGLLVPFVGYGGIFPIVAVLPLAGLAMLAVDAWLRRRPTV